jgi:hypothetical protein
MFIFFYKKFVSFFFQINIIYKKLTKNELKLNINILFTFNNL